MGGLSRELRKREKKKKTIAKIVIRSVVGEARICAVGRNDFQRICAVGWMY